MMPVAVLEATASGLPCLVHQHPVLEWMVGPGGEAIDMATPGELTAALGRWLGDPHRCSEVGRRAREHCVRHFSLDVVVDQVLDYYRRVAAAAPEGAAV
jgi:glycosyltransferase involved in cell wall biosynthesis